LRTFVCRPRSVPADCHNALGLLVDAMTVTRKAVVCLREAHGRERDCGGLQRATDPGLYKYGSASCWGPGQIGGTRCECDPLPRGRRDWSGPKDQGSAAVRVSAYFEKCATRHRAHACNLVAFVSRNTAFGTSRPLAAKVRTTDVRTVDRSANIRWQISSEAAWEPC